MIVHPPIHRARPSAPLRTLLHTTLAPPPRRQLTTAAGPPIQVHTSIAPLRHHRHHLRGTPSRPLTLSLVPTMGALHAGHLSLARAAAHATDSVILSIFVNPTQFAPTEDLSSYPRTLPSDLALLAALNRDLAASGARGRISAVFAPPAAELYPGEPPSALPDAAGTFVTVQPLGGRLEGAARPHFFRGVATVCAKLFNAVQPDVAYFGRKDAQQAAVVRKMVRDLLVPVEVVVGATVRERDGLALSSRNGYLGVRRRRAGLVLREMLEGVRAGFAGGARARGALLRGLRGVLGGDLAEGRVMRRVVQGLGDVDFVVDYVSIADRDSMEEVEVVDEARGAVASAAVLMLPVRDARQGEELGEGNGRERTVRLIDNVVLPAKGEEVVEDEVVG